MLSYKFPTTTRSTALVVLILVVAAAYDIATRIITLAFAEPNVVKVFDGMVGVRAVPSKTSLEASVSWFDGGLAGSAESTSDLPEVDISPEGEVKNLLSDGALYRLAGVFGRQGDSIFAVLQRIKVADRKRQPELVEVRVGDAVGSYSVQNVNLNSVTLVDSGQRTVELVVFEMKSGEAAQQ